MKNMAFNEKSAWAMLVALGLAAVVYVGPLLAAFLSAGQVVPPAPVAILFVIVLIVLSILTHILVALSNPSEATETRDERDRSAILFAGHWSGIVLGFGVIMSLLSYLGLRSGDILFHGVFVSLILASLIEYALKIIAYRRVT